MLGIDLLWTIALWSRFNDVVSLCITFLNSLYQNLGNTLEPLRGEVEDEFLQSCLVQLTRLQTEKNMYEH